MHSDNCASSEAERSAYLSVWEEVARYTVTEDSWLLRAELILYAIRKLTSSLLCWICLRLCQLEP
jgi:hypothetical protein